MDNNYIIPTKPDKVKIWLDSKIKDQDICSKLNDNELYNDYRSDFYDLYYQVDSYKESKFIIDLNHIPNDNCEFYKIDGGNSKIIYIPKSSNRYCSNLLLKKIINYVHDNQMDKCKFDGKIFNLFDKNFKNYFYKFCYLMKY